MKVTRRKVLNLIYIFVGVVFLVILAAAILALRMSFNTSDSKIVNDFNKQNLKVEINKYLFQEDTIRYMVSGNPSSNKALLFVHGAPGGMDMFNGLMFDSELQNDYFLISVDRLGYGGSSYGESEPSLQIQANAINSLINNEINDKDVVVFSHSFGAPIAALMSFSNQNIKHVILAGGAVSPNHERFETLAWISNSKLIRWMASKDTMVASDEKLAHVNELKKNESIWSEFPVYLTVMHGTSDWLVPYENLTFLKERVPKNYFIEKTLEGESHFFINNVELVKSVLNPELNP